MKLRARIAVLLSVWVVVMPASSVLAQQRPASQGSGRNAQAQPSFHADTAEHLVRGRNGVEIATTTGHYHQDGGIFQGGRLSAAAPWGEQMGVRYFASKEGFLAEINGRISTLTRVDERGNAREYVVRVDDQELVIDLAEQNRRLARGGPAIQPWELEGYERMIGALLEEQSVEFWKSLGEVNTAAPAGDGCVSETVKCVQGILSWLGSLSALISICGGTVPSGGTLAPGCLLVILAHPAVTAGAALACSGLLECIEEDSPHGDCGA